MTTFIGTSGWQYRHWRQGAFYPGGLQGQRELAWYSGEFPTVEVNNTFYRVPEASTFWRWKVQSPENFVFALKMNRYVSHVRRLKNCGDAIQTFLTQARRLGTKLGPILIQLPPSLPRDVERLQQTLEAFPLDLRVAFEFRHSSWFVDSVRYALEARDAALCLVDRHEHWLSPLWRTANWTYVRFHEGASSAPPGYQPDALRTRAGILARMWNEDEDVYAYFHNDTNVQSPKDARSFRELMLDARRSLISADGRNVSSVAPAPREIGTPLARPR